MQRKVPSWRAKVLRLCAFAAILLIGLAGAQSGPTPAAAQTAGGWIMAYFREAPDSYNVHMAYSTNGLNWTPLNNNNPILRPTLGVKGIRDPFILRKQEGGFVVMATDLIGLCFTCVSQYIHIWESPDLITFNNYRLLRMHTSNTMHTWAPEAFWDPGRGQYAIIWSGNTDRNRIYVNYTTDFINVTPAQVFFDPGFDVIDANVITAARSGASMNYLYYVSGGALYGARSSSLNPGSFNAGTYVSGLRQGNLIEAPQLMPMGNTWLLYGDSYSPVNNVVYAWRTTSINTNSWTPVQAGTYAPPLQAKHIGITAVTTDQLNAIVARWGGGTSGTVRRLQSYNFQGRYLRHQGYRARIDENVSPAEDAQFRVVPGLAAANAVSFESVNFPGHYLRHRNNEVWLDASDGSALFNADATWHRRAGLANSGWSSYESYNYPGQYLRHSNYLMILGAVSGSTQQADATFREQ